MGTVPGSARTLDVTPITGWLLEHLPDTSAPFGATLIAGGRSNLTFLLKDADGQAFCLRRPPGGPVLPTAHDMGREERIIRALTDTSVPVPQVYGFSGDDHLLGSPFYVMQFVEGSILRSRSDAEKMSETTRRMASESLVDVLAALHEVSPDSIGLGDFARRDGYIERQLSRWIAQFRSSADDEDEGSRLMELAHKRLVALVPPQQKTSIVHGDYKLDNVVLAADGTVRAVLDWEISTLGDPLADLGSLSAYWTDPGERERVLQRPSPSSAPGFLLRSEVQGRYAKQSRLDPSDLNFYIAFGLWKIGCILQGVYARYRSGAAAGDESTVEDFEVRILNLARESLETLSL
ncbi:MAG: phosphotransferase family protein [Acidimicrobiales bacterium]